MILTILNGSPRRKTSNSTILTEKFMEGFRSRMPESTVNMGYIADTPNMQAHIEMVESSSDTIIIFPLYTDCMPGVVKEFLEKLPPAKEPGCKLGFIVHSGFPEPVHSVFAEKYLARLTCKLGYSYTGTLIKGGVEGIQFMPPGMTKKLFEDFRKLGEYYAEHGEFSQDIMNKFRHPLRMSQGKIFLYKLISFTGLTNFFWNTQLKKHGAFEKRFDKPLL
jgi:hypothetical protein